MARKKKRGGSRRKTHHHRRRMGAVSLTSPAAQEAAMEVVGALFGLWAGSMLKTQVAKAFPTADPKWVNWGLGVGEMGAGVWGILESKSAITKGLSFGLALSGAQVIEKQLGLVSGVGYVNLLPQPRMGDAGTYRPVPRLGATMPYRQPNRVAGVRPPNMTAVYAAGSGM